MPVQPSVGVVNISYGFIDEVVFSELSADEQTVPVVIDTPYNIIGVWDGMGWEGRGGRGRGEEEGRGG